VFTSRSRAAHIADRVRVLASDARPTVLTDGTPSRFESLVQQYEIEQPPTSDVQGGR
jgi:hypothetical protein